MDINREIYNFLNSNNESITLIEFIKKHFEVGSFSEKIQLKFITDGQIKVNNSIVKNPDHKLKPGSKIEYDRITKKYKDNVAEYNIDDFYQFLTTKLFAVSDLNMLSTSQSAIVFCHFVHFLNKISYDDVIQSINGRRVDEFLRVFVTKNRFSEDLNLTKQEAKGRVLVIKLIESLKITEEELAKLLKNLENAQYDNQLDTFLRNYANIIHSSKFKFLVEPMTDAILSNRVAIENLIKPIFALDKTSNESSKYQHYTVNKEVFSDYLQKANAINSAYTKSTFIPICNYLLSLFKSKSKIKEEQFGDLEINLLDRRYNINNDELTILFEAKNNGNGIAAECNVAVEENENFKGDNTTKDLGIIQPLDIRRWDIKVFKKLSENFKPTLNLNVAWVNANGETKNKIICLNLQIQDKEIPWGDLKRKKPYSITKIDSEENLFGRDSILSELKENILSNKIESYKIWGQKRVGKSSIVLTLKTILAQEKNIIVVYKEVSRNINPIESLNELGKEISIELLDEILNKLHDINKADRVREVELPQFNGSLQPLERYIKNIQRIDKKLKFVFILDEFDRLNEEFFLPGNIGESFSLSIGKQISGNDNVGFILVGAENMSLLDYQEINYNSFEDQRVDTFDQVKDFEAYTNIIKKPVEPYITYSDEAVNEIFLATNGNPYFTNFICDKLFKSCFERQDSEVDFVEVKKAISVIVDSEQKSHFAHFWGDGLNQDSDAKREKITDIRRRILVSYSNFYHSKKEFPTKNDIIKSFNFPESYSISKDEVESIISSFFTRSIFFSENNSKTIRIKPPLFELWLCGKGRTLIIEGITDLEAQERENEREEIAKIKDDEITRLAEKLKFKSNSLSREKFVDFFKQFGSNVEQRKIFKLIDNLFFVSHDDITDFIKKEKKNIFGNEPIVLKDSSNTLVREGVELYSSSKNKNENEVLVGTFKLLTNIRKTKSLKSLKEKRVWYTNENTKTVIIFEPYISDISKLEIELKDFLESNKDDLIDKKTVIIIFSIVSTKKAKTKLVQLLKLFSNSKFISLHEIEDAVIKPFIESSLILENVSESQQVLFSCRNIYQNISKEESLVVFENLCPVESLKILWKKSDRFNPLFLNHFGDKLDEDFESNKGRETIFKLNTELSQKLNAYIISFLKSQSSNGEWDTIKLVPRTVLEKINSRYFDEKEKQPKETFLDFIDYGEIIKKHEHLKSVLSIKGDLGWVTKLNDLRRIPAHPEKPDPTVEEVEYFEKIHKIIVDSIKNNNNS